MKTRAITGLIFGAVMLTASLWSFSSFCALFFIITAGCLWEYSGLVMESEPNGLVFIVRRIETVVIGILPFLLTLIYLTGVVAEEGKDFIETDFIKSFFLIFVLLGAVLLLVELFSAGARPFQNVGLMLLGVFYIGIPFSLLPYLALTETEAGEAFFQPHLVVASLLLVWTNDVFAYFIGSKIGKNKFFPRISPKKTWEGTIGGAIVCIFTGLLIGWLMPKLGYSTLTYSNWFFIALICAVFGTLGDLVESMLKRSLSIKDSGSLLPGHGGLLDRFDAYIFASLWVFAYIFFAR